MDNKIKLPVLIETVLDKLERSYRELNDAYGESNPDTVRAKLKLISNFSRYEENYDRAAEMAEDTYLMCVTSFGEEDLLTGEAFEKMTSVHRRQDAFDKMISYHEKRYNTLVDILGENHIDTLRLLHDLAWCYRWAGNREKAKELYEQALTLKTAAFGELHPTTVNTLISLASMIECFEDEENLEMLDRLEKASESIAELDDPEVDDAMYQYGEVIKNLTWMDDIGSWIYEDIYEWLEKHEPHNMVAKRTILAELEVQYRADAEYEKMLSAMEKRYEYYVAEYGEHDELSLKLLDELIIAYRKVDSTLDSERDYAIKSKGKFEDLTPEKQSEMYAVYHPESHLDKALKTDERKHRILSEMYGDKYEELLATQRNGDED